MTYQVDLVLNAGNLVGESIVWCQEDEALYWVDICGCNVHRYVPESSRHDTWETPDFPTSIATG
jgi:sugar lactone lactonase YvrE